MRRRAFLQTTGVGLAGAGFGSPAHAQARGKTIVVAHGAWSAGWAWKKMHPLLSAAGHRLITPTQTGLGERELESAKAGDGWRVPANPPPPDTSPEDLKWIQQFRLPQPLKCFQTPLRLHNGDRKIPRAYIYCKRISPDNTFQPFAARAGQEHWDYREIDASHSAQITAPEALTALLHSIMSD
jgi:hypothetical protein